MAEVNAESCHALVIDKVAEFLRFAPELLGCLAVHIPHESQAFLPLSVTGAKNVTLAETSIHEFAIRLARAVAAISLRRRVLVDCLRASTLNRGIFAI